MFCASADFVFNLAGVNRPRTRRNLWREILALHSELLDALRSHGNTAPVMLASLDPGHALGRFGDSGYGRSKKAGEELFLPVCGGNGSEGTGLPVPNLFGKSCRPNYNSAVATFSPQYWPTACQSMSAIRPQSWSCFILTIW